MEEKCKWLKCMKLFYLENMEVYFILYAAARNLHEY